MNEAILLHLSIFNILQLIRKLFMNSLGLLVLSVHLFRALTLLNIRELLLTFIWYWNLIEIDKCATFIVIYRDIQTNFVTLCVWRDIVFCEFNWRYCIFKRLIFVIEVGYNILSMEYKKYHCSLLLVKSHLCLPAHLQGQGGTKYFYFIKNREENLVNLHLILQI